MKKIFLLLSVFIILALSLFVGRKLYTKFYNHARNAQIEISNLYEAMCVRQTPSVDTLSHHVLCLGNSITCMGPNDAVGWKGHWGMAASKKENDYVHLLEARLKSYNPHSSVSFKNIVEWELNPLHKVDSLLAGVMDEKDIIIFRFGDNVDDEEAFSLGLQRMIDYCRQYTSNIIITGCFWKRIHTESVLISAARTNHLKYVPLFWIGETYGDSTYCTGDEVFYDVDGNPYKGEHPAFKLHPNDKGMQMIAETIFDSIF